MKLTLSNKYTLNSLLFLVISTTTILGYMTVDFANTWASFWPAAGFTIGFYLVYGKKGMPGIFTGLIVGHLLSRFLLFDEPEWFSTLYGLTSISADIAFMFLFGKVLKESKVEKEITSQNVSFYIISISLAAFVYSAITSSVYTLYLSEYTFIHVLTRNFLGHLSGGIVFGSIILLSSLYDKEEKAIRYNTTYSIIFLLVFTIYSVILFVDNGTQFDFDSFKYIYLILFFIPAFAFSYKMMLTIAMIYFSLANALYLVNLPIETKSFAALEVNVFLIVIVIVSSLTRMILLQTRRKNRQLEESNIQLEDMVQSTFTLLKLGEKQQFQEEFNSIEYLKDLFEVASKIFKNYDRASCYVRGEEFVDFIAGVKYDITYLNNAKFRIEDFEWHKDIPEHVVESNKMVRQSLKTRYNKFLERTPELSESIKFCIFLEHNLVGGMSFDIDLGSEKSFNKVDFENIKSFQRIMNSFYQARYLIARNNSLRDEIVLSLIRTLELYDQYTGGHSEEVANLSLMIAKRLGLSEKDQYDVFWAGIVHDIGKVGIPSDILNKPERLSLEEYELIKAHPQFGYDILQRSQDLEKIAKLVKHHHEWWNGAGYPDGLKENEIPFGSTIITVADAVSSMATKRPYTGIKTSKEILREIKLYSGSQFSPMVAEEVIKFIEEGLLDKFYLESQTHTK